MDTPFGLEEAEFVPASSISSSHPPPNEQSIRSPRIHRRIKATSSWILQLPFQDRQSILSLSDARRLLFFRHFPPRRDDIGIQILLDMFLWIRGGSDYLPPQASAPLILSSVPSRQTNPPSSSRQPIHLALHLVQVPCMRYHSRFSTSPSPVRVHLPPTERW